MDLKATSIGIALLTLIHFQKTPGTQQLAAQRQLIENGNSAARNAIGNWFETEGRKWDAYNTFPDSENSELNAFFVLKVAAAGWHSAALVLVDEEKAERVKQKHIQKPNNERTHNPEGGQPESEASDESVEAPWDQLTEALHRIGEWFWGMVRRHNFLRLLSQQLQAAGHRLSAALYPPPAAATAAGFLPRLTVLDKLSDALFSLAGMLGGTASADDGLVCTQGRSFLGLTQRDELADKGVDSAEEEEEVRYWWEGEELPLLDLGEGDGVGNS